MRLGRRRQRGGSPRQGRVVNGTTAQVVPKGTIRQVVRSHRRDMHRHVSDTMTDELARRQEPEPSMIPMLPDSWSIERGRQGLADLLARARRSG